MGYIYWLVDEMWLGYLDELPDYQTQGESIQELEERTGVPEAGLWREALDLLLVPRPR